MENTLFARQSPKASVVIADLGPDRSLGIWDDVIIMADSLDKSAYFNLEKVYGNACKPTSDIKRKREMEERKTIPSRGEYIQTHTLKEDEVTLT